MVMDLYSYEKKWFVFVLSYEFKIEELNKMGKFYDEKVLLERDNKFVVVTGSFIAAHFSQVLR